MAKQKPLKKDRLAGKKLYQTEKKKPFYAQMQPRQKQKPKKNHPFGDGWEIADDYEEEMIPAGEYQTECIGLNEDGNGIIRIEGKKLSVEGVLPHEQVTVEVSGKRKLHTKLIRVQKAAENQDDQRRFGVSESPHDRRNSAIVNGRNVPQEKHTQIEFGVGIQLRRRFQ